MGTITVTKADYEKDKERAEKYGTTPERLMRVLGRLRDVHGDISANQAMALLFIAANPGVTLREVHERLGLVGSAASRVLAVLSDFGSRSVAGLGLVRVDVNPDDRRERLLSLTPKGHRLVEDMVRDMDRERLPTN